MKRPNNKLINRTNKQGVRRSSSQSSSGTSNARLPLANTRQPITYTYTKSTTKSSAPSATGSSAAGTAGSQYTQSQYQKRQQQVSKYITSPNSDRPYAVTIFYRYNQNSNGLCSQNLG